MQPIGKIKLVQVQRKSLKLNEDTPQSAYTPEPLLAVPQMLLTPNGSIGVLEDGTNIIDVHNSNHVFARKGGGLSIGFTSNYATMRSRFGNHLTDGIAGENIIIETDHVFVADNLGAEVAIQTANKTYYLAVEKVVVPCTEFSKFCLKNPNATSQEIKETLQFLNDGRRGYKLAVTEDFWVQEGDLFLAEVL